MAYLFGIRVAAAVMDPTTPHRERRLRAKYTQVESRPHA